MAMNYSKYKAIIAFFNFFGKSKNLGKCEELTEVVEKQLPLFLEQMMTDDSLTADISINDADVFSNARYLLPVETGIDFESDIDWKKARSHDEVENGKILIAIIYQFYQSQTLPFEIMVRGLSDPHNNEILHIVNFLKKFKQNCENAPNVKWYSILNMRVNADYAEKYTQKLAVVDDYQKGIFSSAKRFPRNSLRLVRTPYSPVSRKSSDSPISKSKHNQKIKSLETELSNVTRLLCEREAESDQLRDEVNQLKDMVEKLEAKRKQANDDIVHFNALKISYDKIEKDKEELEKKVQDLNKAHQSLDKEYQDYALKTMKKLTEAETLESKNRKLEEEKAKLESDFRDFKELYVDLEAKLEEVYSDKTTLQDQLDQVKQELEDERRLKRENQRLSRVSIRDSEVKELLLRDNFKMKLDELKAEYETKMRKIEEDCKKEVEAIQRDREEVAQEFQQKFEKEIAVKDEEIKLWHQKHLDTFKKLEKRERELENLRQEAEGKDKQVIEYKVKATESEAKLEILEEEVREWRKKFEQLAESTVATEVTLNKLRQDFGVVEHELVRTKQSLGDLEVSNSKLQQDNDEIKVQNRDLQERNSKLETEVRRIAEAKMKVDDELQRHIRLRKLAQACLRQANSAFFTPSLPSSSYSLDEPALMYHKSFSRC